MADYLTVNRFNIPIMESSPIIQPKGRYARGVDGFGGSSFTSLKRAWKLRTILMDAAELEAAQGLLLGEGHAWDFEDVTLFKTSSRGLDDDTASGMSRSASGQKYGAACLLFSSGSASISWLTGLLARWTVAFWFDTGTGYVHHAHDSDGNFYLDGVIDTPPSEPGVVVSATGKLTLTDNNVSAHVIDDLIAVPYLMSPTLIASIAADNSPFSPLPEIEVSGDIAKAGGLLTGIIPAALVRPKTFSRSTVHLDGGRGGDLSFDLVEG